MTEHELKCWPDYYQAIIDGRKNFEVRYDDRGFQAGDEVVLREYDPAARTYTGRQLHARIGHVLDSIPSPWQRHPLQPRCDLNGYVVFSLLDIEDPS